LLLFLTLSFFKHNEGSLHSGLGSLKSIARQRYHGADNKLLSEEISERSIVATAQQPIVNDRDEASSRTENVVITLKK
jgi:hypothetical protein